MAWLEYAGALVQSIDSIGKTVAHAQDDPNRQFTRLDYKRYNPISTFKKNMSLVPYGYGKRKTAGFGVRSRLAKRRTRVWTQSMRSGKYRRVGNFGRFSETNAYRLAVGINEKKWFDTVIDFAANISTTGENSISFNLIPGGADPEERVGRKIRVFSMHVRGAIAMASVGTGSGEAERIRLVYILDSQCNGTVPAVTELLEVADINSFLKLENSGRFRIIKEILVDMHHSTGAGNGSANDFGASNKSFKFTHTWKDPLIIEWGGITGTISTVKSNNLYCMAISANANSTVSINSCIRIRFTD